MIDKDGLLKKLSKLPLNQFEFIDSGLINFSQDVRDMCKMNTCGKYNQNWQCPPGVGKLEDKKNECLKYENALLFNTVTGIEDSFDFEGMMEAGVKHKQLTLQIRDFIKSLTGDFLILGAGGCSICDKCAYLDNEPCRNPGITIASMEAYGIYVVELCKATGFKYINGQNTVTYFSLILF